jgi:hypothetical protein
MPDAVIYPTPQERAAFGLGKLPERAAASAAAGKPCRCLGKIFSLCSGQMEPRIRTVE